MKGLACFGAFVGGLVAGVALGVLVAPEKGSDTRKKIGGTVKDFCKKHSINLSKEEMESLVDDLSLVSAEL